MKNSEEETDLHGYFSSLPPCPSNLELNEFYNIVPVTDTNEINDPLLTRPEEKQSSNIPIILQGKITSQYSTFMETDFDSIVSKWLRFAKQRKKKEKIIENNVAENNIQNAAENNTQN
ncbi:uncharacterized protein LOC112588294 [Harpegnathos saltator]|uniref:uncharacterized protein LOC112588294 n=1 Tax=Harpegnathos saltator TaxID=610380 RepID=UPI000DBED59D|nr:uncharacterized protein LOC112588294 [Harpegnathos saltator]